MASTKVPIELSSTPGIVDNSNATAITIDSSENVGIGTSSPSGALHVSRSGLEAGITLERTTSATAKFTIAANDGNLVFTDQNQSAERMRIDSSGNVGIGNNAPTHRLFVTESGSPVTVYLSSDAGNNSTTGRLRIGGALDRSASIQGYRESSSQLHALVFTTYSSGDVERMRIDSSGRLIVGNSSPFAADSVTIDQGGFLAVRNTSGSCMEIRRDSTDGTLIDFQKDGSAVGSIGTLSDSLYIGNAVSLAYANIRFTNDEVFPCQSAGGNNDDAIDLGKSNSRWRDIYAGNGTINTSDANEKQDIEELSEAETRVAVAAKGLLKKFRWKSAVEEKGDEARIHFGIIAQDLQDAFAAEGLDASDYGMWCSDTWTDEETGEEKTRLGVRYHELLAFIIAGI